MATTTPAANTPGTPGTLFTQWKHLFLTAIGAPETPANEQFLDAWASREGTAARYNPLATTWQLPGSVALPGNSAGVQQYPDVQTGARATALTLMEAPNGQPTYPDVLAALRSGKPSLTAYYPGLKTWSGNGYASPGGAGAAVGAAAATGGLTITGAGGDLTDVTGAATATGGTGGGLGSLLAGLLEMTAGGVLLLGGIVIAVKLGADKVGLDLGADALHAIPGVGQVAGARSEAHKLVAVRAENNRRTGAAAARSGRTGRALGGQAGPSTRGREEAARQARDRARRSNTPAPRKRPTVVWDRDQEERDRTAARRARGQAEVRAARRSKYGTADGSLPDKPPF